MDGADRTENRDHTGRIVLLVIGGIVLANVVGALLFDRDTALGVDDLVYILIGLALGAIVEIGYFRRRDKR